MTREFYRQRKLAASYRAVFDSPEGKIVLADMMQRGMLLEVVTVAGDPQMSGFNDGKRAHILETLDMLRWESDQVLQLARMRELQMNETQEEQVAA